MIRTDQGPYAGFGVRLAASIVDGFLSGLLVLTLAAGLAVLLALALSGLAVDRLELNGDLGREASFFVAGVALTGSGSIILLALCAYLLYFLLFTAFRGQTPGKMLLGIR